MFKFEIHPEAITSGSLLVLLIAIIVFVVVPVILAVVQYRISKNDHKKGQMLMLGAFGSAILFGAYSLLIGVLLLVVHLFAGKPKISRVE